MHRPVRIVLSVVLFSTLLSLLGGCGSIRRTGVEHSGFLGDLSDLEAATGEFAGRAYSKSPDVLSRYSSFLVDPVLLYFAPEADAVAIEPTQLADLALELRTEVITQLRDGGYEVVDAPGPGVLRVQTAITELDMASPVANAAGKVVGTLTLGSGFLVPALDVGKAAIEVEMRDAESNERLIAFIDAREGKRLGGTMDAVKTWGHVRAAFRSWAQGFRQALDRAHQR